MQSDMINPPDGIAKVATPSLMFHTSQDALSNVNQLLKGGSDSPDSHTGPDQNSSSHESTIDLGVSSQKRAPSPSPSPSSTTAVAAAAAASSSSFLSLPRRCPVPPSLKLEGTILSDIGEEDDIRSQRSGHGAAHTPAPSSSGLLTPQLADDASTIYTLDDESENTSEADLGSRAERRLESAKKRLTNMEGHLSLAQSSSYTLKQPDEDDAVTPSAEDAAQQHAQEQIQRNDAAEETIQSSEAKQAPPRTEFVLPRLASTYSHSTPQLNTSHHGHDSKNRQRTTSLAEALMRRSALNLTTGNANGSGKYNSSRNSSATSLPLKPSSHTTDDRNATLKGSHGTPQLKPQAQAQAHLRTARSSSSAELQSQSASKAGRSHSYPHRSRSAMTMQSGGAGPSSRKQPSSSISYEPSHSSLSHSQSYHQLYQQRLHMTSTAPPLSSRYSHSRTPSGASSARVLAIPTTPASRAEQVRELKDQVTGLKIKISTLKVKTQADSLRRRKNERLNKDSKDSSERPSLFTDARQISNGNGFMSHAKFKNGNDQMRIDRKNPLGIIYGPVDRVQIRKPLHQNTFTPLESADTGRRFGGSAFDRLPPLEELSSPMETGTVDYAAVRPTNERQSINEQARNRDRYQRQQILSTNSADQLRDNKSGFTEANTSYDQGYRRNSTSKSNFPASPGFDEFGFYGTNEEYGGFGEDERAVEEWDEDQYKLENGPSSTARQAPNERRMSKSLEYQLQNKGTSKRAGDDYRHRRVTWSDDLCREGSKAIAKSKRVTSRHLRRSRSAAVASEIDKEDKLNRLRRAQSSTLHRKSQRFSPSTRHEWASSESESDYMPRSDESDDGHVTTPHEERADAFDYEHFVLHSAMAQFAIQNDSEASFTEAEDSGEIEEEQEQADEPDNEGEVAEDGSDDPQHEVDPNGDSDNDSVKTAKNVGEQDNSSVSRRSSSKSSQRQTEPPAAESKLLAPIAKYALSSKESLESLSTVLTFETATEGRSSSEDLSESLDDEQSTQHKRDASDKTVTIQNPEKGLSGSASMKYKFSSIRNASSPTVLIQPRSFENRASSRASSRKGRSRVSNATAYVQTIDRGVQTSPEPQPAKLTPVTSPTQQALSPAYQSPQLKVAPTPLHIHTETESLRSSSSARTADSGTSASVSSVTAPAAAAPAQASATNSRSDSPHRNTLGSPLSLRKHSIADSQTSSPGSPLPDLQEVVASLISTAANRFAPASVMNNTALSPEQGDSTQPSHMGSPLTQMQDQDLARLSALFTSVGQLAFRLQVSIADQEKQLATLPEHSPHTPSSGHSPAPAVRAAHVLRERLEAARRVLDGKLEIPQCQK